MSYSAIKDLIEDEVISDIPDAGILNDRLEELAKSGFISNEDKEKYAFKDQVTWEVVYETLLYSERRVLHDLIACHIESENEDNLDVVAARLVYHYENASNIKRTTYYQALAGDYAYSLFAIDDALSFYRKALANIESIEKRSSLDKCLLLEKEADIMEATGCFPESIVLYEKSLLAFDKSSSSFCMFLDWKPESKKIKSRLNHKLSVSCEKSLNYKGALDYLDKAELYLPQRPGNIPTKINATRGVIYSREMNFDKARIYANKSLDLAKRKKSYSDIAYAYNLIANIYSNQGDKLSIEYFEKSLTTYKKINDLNGISMSCYNLGGALSSYQEFEKANDYFFKSLEINTKMQNKLALMEDNFMLGNNKIFTREYDVALDYFNNAIEIYEKGLDRKDYYALSLSRVADIYIHKNDVVKSEKYIQKAIDTLSNLSQSPAVLAQVKIVMVDLRIHEGKYAEAEKLCHDLINEFTRLCIPLFTIYVMKQLGIIYTKKAQYDKSLETFNSALSLALEINSISDQLVMELNIINIDVLKGVANSDSLKRLYELLEKFKKYNNLVEVDFTNEIIKKLESL